MPCEWWIEIRYEEMVTISLTPGKLHSKCIYSSRKNNQAKFSDSASMIPRGTFHDIQRYKGTSPLTIVETTAAKQKWHETLQQKNCQRQVSADCLLGRKTG